MRRQIETLRNRIHPRKGFVYANVRSVRQGERAWIEATAPTSVQQHGPVLGVRAPVPRLRPPSHSTIRIRSVVGGRPVRCVRPAAHAVPRARRGRRVHAVGQWKFADNHRVDVLSGRLGNATVEVRGCQALRHVLGQGPPAAQWVVHWGLEHRNLEGDDARGIDELAFGKGHKYMTLVYDISAGSKRLLWLRDKRTKATVKQFFV